MLGIVFVNTFLAAVILFPFRHSMVPWSVSQSNRNQAAFRNLKIHQLETTFTSPPHGLLDLIEGDSKALSDNVI